MFSGPSDYVLRPLQVSISSCGGGSSGGGGNSPEDPGGDQSGDANPENGDKPGERGDECKSIDCQPQDHVRSLLSSGEFLKMCEKVEEFLVDDKCGNLRVEFGLDEQFKVGNTASDAFLVRGKFSEDVMDTAPYIRMENEWNNGNRKLYRYHIEGDETSTQRLRSREPGISDVRTTQTGELYLDTLSGSEHKPISLTIFGVSIAGWLDFQKAGEMCEKAYESWDAVDTEFFSDFDGWSRENNYYCSARYINKIDTLNLAKWTIKYRCLDESRCYIRGVTFFREYR